MRSARIRAIATYSLLFALTTPANVAGSDGVSNFCFLAGVETGLLLFSEVVASLSVGSLRFDASLCDKLGDAERELLALFVSRFLFFVSGSESLLSELESVDESREKGKLVTPTPVIVKAKLTLFSFFLFLSFLFILLLFLFLGFLGFFWLFLFIFVLFLGFLA